MRIYPRPRRHARRRPARVIVTERIRGGLRGFLNAVDAWLDPDCPEPERTDFRPSQQGSDRRARQLASHRRGKAAGKRSPF